MCGNSHDVWTGLWSLATEIKECCILIFFVCYMQNAKILPKDGGEAPL